PHRSLAGLLGAHFDDPRLAQLFARYATYVGGLPAYSPALLSLVWEAERRGVWHVRGGMYRLAQAIERLARQRGAHFLYDTPVTRIEVQDGRPCAVHAGDTRLDVDAVLFNGDPRALVEGLLGHGARDAVARSAVEPRSLSAHVQAFAADVAGDFPLAAHNVFFADDPLREYAPLAQGGAQDDPTLYVCAQDRFGGARPRGAERFEIILNAAPITGDPPVRPTAAAAIHPREEHPPCHTLIFKRLARFGLRFSPAPDTGTLTSPAAWNSLFPGSNGSLYGRSPHGMMAAFQRPTARTKMQGLYLVGGGAHPGAGVPMATLSGQHAAEAMAQDLGLTSTSQRADTRGGMSTA
ncbi:FAD-dependent oxidoreductase, partial [Sulfitobacter sp. HNIBRBA3233]|uniref:phytoene desaturase family protein n=1 Tax=Sulfitobacter marinivivus TaxID=3158558 RepID=UPI0032E018B4